MGNIFQDNMAHFAGIGLLYAFTLPLAAITAKNMLPSKYSNVNTNFADNAVMTIPIAAFGFILCCCHSDLANSTLGKAALFIARSTLSSLLAGPTFYAENFSKDESNNHKGVAIAISLIAALISVPIISVFAAIYAYSNKEDLTPSASLPAPADDNHMNPLL